MSQLNIHMTPIFEKNLRHLMKVRHIETKAEAIRIAVNEALEHFILNIKPTDFTTWIGLAKQSPINTKPQFKSDDGLWKQKRSN